MQTYVSNPVFQGILNTNNTFKIKIDQMEDKVKMMMDINKKSIQINDLCLCNKRQVNLINWKRKMKFFLELFREKVSASSKLQVMTR